MSQIDKLLIRGIRSFDPKGPSVIEFYTPLTIIVGHNGAGKTTIIECLKYATTGDQPPNSKYGAFIYDPKLAHETEVLAQVKLRFKNVNGREMVCTRSLSLTQKKTGVQQKTLESLLKTNDPDTGESHSLSTRCAELDAEIPLQLGVSKAILDNVIFCHQEESFWPLSESSILKKKFDEIFASTRYTKALDSIKTLRKEQSIQLRLAQNNLEHLKSKKAKVEKVRETLAVTQEKYAIAQQRIDALDAGEIEEAVARMTSLMEQNKKLQDLTVRVKQSVLERDMIAKNIRQMRESLQEYTESDMKLKELLTEYEMSLNTKETEHSALESKVSKLSAELNRVQSEHSQILTSLGQLQAEKSAHERRLQEREKVIIELSSAHNYSGFDMGALSEDHIHRFTQNLRGQIEERNAGLESLKMECKERENAMMSDIQRLKATVASVEETKKMTRRQMDNHRQKISQHMQTMHGIKVTQADVDQLHSRIAEEESALEQSRRDWGASDFEAKLGKLNQELREYDFQLRRATDEMALLNMQANTRASLSLKKLELERKEEAYTRSVAAVQSETEQFLGHMPPPEVMVREVESLYRMKQKSVKQLQEHLENKSRELSSVDTKLHMARTTLTAKTQQLSDKVARIKSVIGGEDYSAAVANAEQDIVEKRDELSSMRSAGSMYQKFIAKFQANGCCPLCVRGFEGSDGSAFLAKVPEVTQAAEGALQAAEMRRNALSELRTDWDYAERLRNVEIPEIRTRMEQDEDERHKIASASEDIASELAVVEVEMQNADILLQKSEEVLRLHLEIQQIREDVKRINTELSSSGSTKTMEEVQQSHEQLQDKCQSVRRSIERINDESRMKQRDIQSNENRVRDIKEQLQAANYQFQERKKLQASIADLKAEIEILQRDTEDAESKARDVAPVIRQKETALSRYREQMNAKEAEFSKSISSLQHSLNRLMSIDNEIRRFTEQRGEGKLRQCEVDLQTVDARTREINAQITRLNEEMQTIRDQRADVHNLRRQIDDNLKYRHLQREHAAAEDRIDLLKKEISGYDQTSIDSQYTTLKRKHERLVEERAGLVGESKQMQEQLRQLKGELSTDYKDVEEQYRKQLVELKTEEMANHDLEKYAKALDNAIMKYHSMKMEEINKIIRELWVNTYQGSDIDTIEIRSDNENVKGNRQYNYRVVMVKGDTALDMRGRCSAGQKVLTSLIIRLALAETFCLNCGILALDEPTTNLDRDNIESLAESLANIIKLRRQQSNFQLLIITHDEEFMQLLGKSEYADYYWRISKDDEGHSVITRQAIQDS
ncbi:rad50 [Spizellomyces punctatus DAOM BR117]|uniref:DNA repair protein RAD50 n=1 Tax=Spizellomyces punctatus (strain DAOM BR117) TaxID=645134 RepID=A0A0L0H6I0_SPIPD|nr:rad50 [Spizellomyces punctatus DAOM BR117]KNC96521.1 rad50 [Spizellomyces punctatus DAOM BR117]|eukprot:XP_016604561.1 rad50 [Spizellomyces punctatus DAOM BR117]